MTLPRKCGSLTIVYIAKTYDTNLHAKEMCCLSAHVWNRKQHQEICEQAQHQQHQALAYWFSKGPFSVFVSCYYINHKSFLMMTKKSCVKLCRTKVEFKKFGLHNSTTTILTVESSSPLLLLFSSFLARKWQTCHWTIWKQFWLSLLKAFGFAGKRALEPRVRNILETRVWCKKRFKSQHIAHNHTCLPWRQMLYYCHVIP